MAKVTVAEHVIKATRCDWLLATTNVEFARTLHNKPLTDSIFESATRLLSWSGQQHTNVLASLRPAYIRQLLGVSRQIIRRLGISRLMYARHYTAPPGRPVQSNTNSASLGSIQPFCKCCALKFPRPSIARYSFIHLSELVFRGDNKSTDASNQCRGDSTHALLIETPQHPSITLVTIHRCIDASQYLGRRYVYRIATQVSPY